MMGGEKRKKKRGEKGKHMMATASRKNFNDRLGALFSLRDYWAPQSPREGGEGKKD